MTSGGAHKRSPARHRDEIILALELYVRAGCLGGGALPSKDDHEVIDVSRRINALPIGAQANRAETFRNRAGVALKLANFRAIERDLTVQRGFPGASDLPAEQTPPAIRNAVAEEWPEERTPHVSRVWSFAPLTNRNAATA